MLRMLGFDTLYDNFYHDDEVRENAIRDSRVVLTRDRELLKCADITHGRYVHALRPLDQCKEIVTRLQLERDARPFTLCLHCNETLQEIDKARVVDDLPENVAKYYQRFCTCPACRRIYWEGSHWKRMRGWLDALLAKPLTDS